MTLKKCRLNQCVVHEGLFDMVARSHDGMPPYLLGNKVYPLLPWLMTHKEEKEVHLILELLHNNKLLKSNLLVVENALGNMKKLVENPLK